MSVENFTIYTEVEEAADIYSVAASKIDFTDVPLNENSYVYKDFNAGHFGDFTHLITVYLSDTNLGSATSICGYGLQNEITDYVGVTGDALITMIRGDSSAINDIKIREKDGGVEGAEDIGTISFNTIYYLTVSRSGDTYQVLIYDDADRTSLVDTLSITCIETTFQYCMAVETTDYGANTNRHITGYIENLDLQEAAPPSGIVQQGATYLLKHKQEQNGVHIPGLI